jgi:DNA-binding NarL/FixJ family response regulator
MIRVVLADDHRLVREGIASLLRLAPDISIVGEASHGEEALELLRAHKPDVALFDVRMPKLDGVGAFEKARAGGFAPPTILITTFDDDEALKAAIAAGVAGFLLKDVSFDVLATAIRKAAAGERVGSIVTSAVREKVNRGELDFDAYEKPDPLTAREVDVLRLIAAGMSNREIGDALGVSEGTVKNHTSAILSKLGVRDRTRAVLKAIQRGDL